MVCQVPTLKNGDTLATPRHKSGGELRRFNRVMANPPFSQNYETEGMEHKERFRYGWAPETGKKADLMFVQHMWSVLMPDGLLVTVMPHGVLFRGGREKEIRQGFIDGINGEGIDLIEAVIGLPQNLFYGTNIPACLLVMRQSGKTKPKARQGKVLFINADREYHEGRAQNYLLPEHMDKIAATYEQWREMPGYSKIVSRDDIRKNDYNLNIRRYADNAPPPEPQDVTAHLLGGIPVKEIEGKQPLFQAHGFNSKTYITSIREGYSTFKDTITNRAALKNSVEADAGVQANEKELRTALTKWWDRAKIRISDLPHERRLMDLHKELLDGFNKSILPLEVFDTYKCDGIFVSWWDAHLHDLKTLMAANKPDSDNDTRTILAPELAARYLITAWLDNLKSKMDESEEKGSKVKVNLKTEPLVMALLPEELAVLQKLDDKQAEIESRMAEFDTAPEGEDWEQEEEDQTYSGYLEDTLKSLKEKVKANKSSASLKKQVEEIEKKLEGYCISLGVM